MTLAMNVIDISTIRCVFPKPHGRAPRTPGKADPIWGTAFTTKFSAKPKSQFVQPIGTIGAFSARADELTPEEEIKFLESTQHLELASTLDVFRANSVSASSLDSETADPDLFVAQPFDGTAPPLLSAEHIAAMSRRIEWERYRTCNGTNKHNWHQLTWQVTPQGLAIKYQGPEKNADRILGMKRSFKYDWIDRFGSIPSAEDITNSRLRAEFYGGTLVQLDEHAKREYDMSRKFGTEDKDPHRDAFVQDEIGPRPVRADYDTDDMYHLREALCPDGPERLCNEFYHDLSSWQATTDAVGVGYAGPSGLLGIDEDA